MRRSHDEFQGEPIPGLPERLPVGERILWQGSPLWWDLTKRVFHIRVVAVYFGVLIACHAAMQVMETGTGLFRAILSPLPIALIGLGLLTFLGWLSSKTTIYTITNRRVVLRVGIALPTAINIPFSVIGAAQLRLDRNGAGDIPLSLTGRNRISYSSLWPHARPWRFQTPEPMLRSVSDAGHVAEVLSGALHAALGASTVPAPGGISAASEAGPPSPAAPIAGAPSLDTPQVANGIFS
ncbi:photosynthetic complex putative assembly protein PuhB [Telmatospirillum siberiense]|uniref:YdbS-like PH domain-containing protein n=1 Tax=Telmatospirillum siberiense TaxID=382514 RepID=A0A2N3PTB7_9PROT|nr:photosynthetic complex putative assembly protein PuhB [Telmatospirillum siberiense]PKU23644.1 hypothetical protein CWS72_15310 [Telmatospirillum siberiense]